MKAIKSLLFLGGEWTLIYLAFAVDVQGAYNILAALITVPFVLAFLVALSAEGRRNLASTPPGLPRWMTRPFKFAEIAVLLWCGSFWLAAMEIIGWLVVTSARELGKDEERKRTGSAA